MTKKSYTLAQVRSAFIAGKMKGQGELDPGPSATPFEDSIIGLIDQHGIDAVTRDGPHAEQVRCLIGSIVAFSGVAGAFAASDRLEARIDARFGGWQASALAYALEHRFAEVIPSWPI